VSYPDDILVDGERVLTHERPHPKMLVLPAAVFLVTLGACSYLGALIGPRPWGPSGQLVLLVLALVLIGWFCVAPLLRWRCTHFVVTDRRVLVREGVLTRTGFEIPMNRITGVQFRQGLIERMVGCGTLSVESASDEPLDFEDIPRVQHVYGLLYQSSADYR
jgi:membrane protein YdbS with pleckstrin-like domain